MPFTNSDGVVTLLKPPEGYVVDFNNPRRNYVLEHYVVCGVGGTLAFLALAQRFYTKIFLLKGLLIDDAFMFIGWASSVATQALTLWLIIVGANMMHGWEMTMDRYEIFQMGLYTSAPVYALCGSFTKLSLLAFYLQISPEPKFRKIVWASIGLIAVYTLTCTCILVFPCRPLSKAWDVYMPANEGKCIFTPPLYIVTAAANILTDLICFALPFKMVIGLNMRRKLKLGYVIVFLIASMTIITSFVRLFYLFPMLTTKDQTWDIGAPSVWVCVEANLFIICGSMPTTNKFCSHFGLGSIVGAISGADRASEQPKPNYDLEDHSRYGPGSRDSTFRGFNQYRGQPKLQHRTNTVHSDDDEITRHDGYQRFGDDDDEDAAANTRRSTTRNRREGSKQRRGEGDMSPQVVKLYPINDATGQKSDDLDRILGVVTHDVTVGSASLADDRSDKAIIQSKTFTIRYD